MTTVSSNGSNRSESSASNSNPLKSSLLEQVASRPDRNTHNGQTAQIKATTEAAKEQMMSAVYTMLESVGEDPEREGLLKTPKRVAEAMEFLTSGYNQSLDDLVNGAIFDEGHNLSLIHI
jgi:GTP cyclohydrolase I